MINKKMIVKSKKIKGDLIYDGHVEIKNDLEISGDLKCKSLYSEFSLVVKGDKCISGFEFVFGPQYVLRGMDLPD